VKAITPTGIVEKNQISDGGAWILLVELDVTGLGGTVYYMTSNNANITWNGILWAARPMQMGDVSESIDSKIPRLTLQLADTYRWYAPLLYIYDGMQGATVRLRVVHSDNLNITTPDVDETYSVVEAKLNQDWLEFTLGCVDPLGKRFPRDRYVASMCRHRYRGRLCQYAGVEPYGELTCDHTLLACERRGNEVQYGGSPGVTEGLYG